MAWERRRRGTALTQKNTSDTAAAAAAANGRAEQEPVGRRSCRGPDSTGLWFGWLETDTQPVRRTCRRSPHLRLSHHGDPGANASEWLADIRCGPGGDPGWGGGCSGPAPGVCRHHRSAGHGHGTVQDQRRCFLPDRDRHLADDQFSNGSPNPSACFTGRACFRGSPIPDPARAMAQPLGHSACARVHMRRACFDGGVAGRATAGARVPHRDCSHSPLRWRSEGLSS